MVFRNRNTLHNTHVLATSELFCVAPELLFFLQNQTWNQEAGGQDKISCPLWIENGVHKVIG